MNRRWTWILVVGFLLVGAAAGQAEPIAELSASYNAIFLTDAEPIEEPVEVVPIDGEVFANIYCCTHTGACVSTNATKCTTTYRGTVHNSILECRRAGCT